MNVLLIQKILIVPLCLISFFILIRRIYDKEFKLYLDWQFPMFLALAIDIFLVK